MITLTKGGTSSVTVTLRELSELSTPIYIFNFLWDENNVSRTFSTTDVSGWTRRYNQFVIHDPSTVVLNYGWGTYRAYESTNGTTPIGDVLEIGRFYVPGSPTDFYQNNNPYL